MKNYRTTKLRDVVVRCEDDASVASGAHRHDGASLGSPRHTGRTRGSRRGAAHLGLMTLVLMVAEKPSLALVAIDSTH